MIDDTHALQPTCRNRLGGEQHFLGDMDLCGIQEGEQAGHVVRHAVLGGCRGKGDIRRGDNEVAGQHRFTGTAPDAAFDHGDHWRRKVFQFANQVPQRIAPAERIKATLGEFRHIVASRPDLDSRRSSQYGTAHFLADKVAQRGNNLIDQRLGKRIAFGLVSQGDGADGTFELCRDHRVTEVSAVFLSMARSISQYSFCGSTGVGSSAQLQPPMIPEKKMPILAWMQPGCVAHAMTITLNGCRPGHDCWWTTLAVAGDSQNLSARLPA